ncbi:hypothetical protein AIIKEEIJ_04064 [Rhodococcus sp. YH1]|nr:hypothetical protein [Rhodococcus sp. YH1]
MPRRGRCDYRRHSMETGWDEHAVRALRAALHTSTDTVLELVRGRPADAVLQLIGDALVAAVDDRLPGAREVATRCAAALHVRGWTGDAELADQLEAALARATPTLRPLPVDLDELSSQLEGDVVYGGGRLDLETGHTWPAMVIDEMSDDDADGDPDRWLFVECVGSRPGYRDMEVFLDSVADPALAEQLRIALGGRGAFRRFKDVLSQSPNEFHRYRLFSDERRAGRARAWLTDQGYRVRPRRIG